MVDDLMEVAASYNVRQIYKNENTHTKIQNKIHQMICCPSYVIWRVVGLLIHCLEPSKHEY